MSNDKALKAQLEEKEQLVAALTERLELAAEQLDRFQRSGADRGGRNSSGAGLPTDLVEKHESLVDNMQLAVEQWNEMQAGLTLSRLESQMAELCSRVQSNGASLSAPQHALEAQNSAATEEAPPVEGESEEEGDRWAALKSYLLDENEAATPESLAAESSSEDSPQEENKATNADAPIHDDASDRSVVPPEEAIGPPAPIAEGETDVTRLRTAIESRDEYIGYLLRKLRYANSQVRLPDNWDEWDGKPEALCRQVEELQNQLTEALRVSELEHSLERARLAREESRVRQMEETARKAMRQLGLDPELDGAEEIEAERNAGGGNRWLKMLGICNDDDEEEWID